MTAPLSLVLDENEYCTTLPTPSSPKDQHCSAEPSKASDAGWRITSLIVMRDHKGVLKGCQERGGADLMERRFRVTATSTRHL